MNTTDYRMHKPWTETQPSGQFLVDIEEPKDNRENIIERKLKHSEFRLKQAQAIAHIGSWEFDPGTGIGNWSEECCRIYGVSQEANLHTYATWLSFIHPDDLEFVEKISGEGIQQQRNTAFDHRIVRPNGEVRYIHTKTQVEVDSAGRPISIYGITHDVTETKLAELALVRSEANLKMIIDLMPQCVFAKDGNGRFTFVNKAFASLYGKTPEEMLNRSILDLIPAKKHAKEILKQDRQVINSGEKMINPDQCFTDSAGNLRHFHTVKAQYTDAGTNEKLVLGIANDITEQRLAETERSKMIAEIIMRNKSLEKFSYIVSHNLRAPVANIMGLSDVLQIPQLAEEDKKDLLAKLETCSGRLNEVVIDLNNILQVDRIESRKKEDIKLSEIVADAKFGFGALIKKEGIRIKSDFSEVNKFFTIKDYMYSIFFNLISNSIKFRSPDTNCVIQITSSIQEDRLQIKFKDNCIGIDLKKRSEEIFGMYKRFHFHVDGKGIGLFMVKTQIESMGGKISVLSEVNKGTEFIIELPIN